MIMAIVCGFVESPGPATFHSDAASLAERKKTSVVDTPLRRNESPGRALGIDMIDLAGDGAVGEIMIVH
jgi:hypothetical protein